MDREKLKNQALEDKSEIIPMFTIKEFLAAAGWFFIVGCAVMIVVLVVGKGLALLAY